MKCFRERIVEKIKEEHCGFQRGPPKKTLDALVLKDSTGQATLWTTATANEFGHLAQGI